MPKTDNHAAPVSRSVTIVNKRGLHARASAKFVKLACTFDSHVHVSKEETEVCGTSIMGLLLLAAAPGDTVHIRAQGPDASDALEALVGLIENRFDEDK